MSNPFFSVIVPAHNSAEFIRKGLESIKNQEFDDYELTVVCDACTDDTAEVAISGDPHVEDFDPDEIPF